MEVGGLVEGKVGMEYEVEGEKVGFMSALPRDQQPLPAWSLALAGAPASQFSEIIT
jgi:hypothetical protein